MCAYAKPAHQIHDRDRLFDLCEQTRFGHLVFAAADDGQLVSSSLPFVVRRRDSPPAAAARGDVVQMHVSRANPLWRALPAKNALLIVPCNDAYVSASFFAAKEENGGRVVPTWDYQVVQVRGELVSKLGDDEWLNAHLNALTDSNECHEPHAWHMADAPEDYLHTKRKGIVGIELRVTQISGVAKLNQQLDEKNRRGLLEKLSARRPATDKHLQAMRALDSAALVAP